MPENGLIEGVRDLVSREIAPTAAEVDRAGALPADRWTKLGLNGLAGLAIPPSWGGVGADRATSLDAIGLMAGACGSTAWAYLSHATVATAILAVGSEAQKDRYLPALAEARLVGGALAATETGGGSNPFSIRTFARAEGDAYVLDGGKFFISQAGTADLYLVLARTDRAPGPGSFTCLLVERDNSGLSFGQREETMGLRGVEVREIFFDHCQVPADRVLGGVGGGLGIIGAVAGFSVLGAAAAALGIAQAAMDATITHLKDRTVVDQPLAAVPGVQARLARAAMDLEGARASLARGLAWVENGTKGAPVPVWMAKVAVTEAAVRVIDQCLGLHGAAGYSRSLPLERYYRDARAFCIHWGNNDVFTDMIGKTVLA